MLAVLCYLFLQIYFLFGSENSQYCKHVYYEHIHIYFEIFQHLQILISKSGIMVSLDMVPRYYVLIPSSQPGRRAAQRVH
jgi:hypothetical protein